MNKTDVTRFLSLLGADNIIDADDWIRCSCPLAPAWHISKQDENPSFGIRVRESEESFFHCFTCGSGTLGSLLSKLTWAGLISIKARDFCLLREAFPKLDIEGRTRPSYQDPFESVKHTVPEVPIPVGADVLGRFPVIGAAEGYENRRCMEWFGSRGITKEAVKHFDIRYDRQHQIIIFPIMDRDGRTYKLHARSRIDKIFYHITPTLLGIDAAWGRKDVWFGMQWYTPWDIVFLVESETDVMRLASLGFTKVLASCGGISAAKIRRILSLHVILGFDADDPGKSFARKAIKYLNQGTRITVLDWGVIGRKDAGALESFNELAVVWESRKIFVKGGDALAVRKNTGYKDVFVNA